MKRYLTLLLLFISSSSLCAFSVKAEELTVSAAISLSEAFTEIGHCYELKHPGTKIFLNFASSGALLKQLSAGAPVDILATADIETMDKAERRGLIKPSSRKLFATNSLVMIVPSTSNVPLRKVADLNKPLVKYIAIGDPSSVPAGGYAKAALLQQGQWSKLQSKLVYAQNVRQVLDYVTRGEVAAGFVYASDAALDPGRTKVVANLPLPSSISYVISQVKASQHTSSGEDFILFILSTEGQAILDKYHFASPGTH